MKYQTKLILCFATVAFLLSNILGVIVYKTSLNYEIGRREESLEVTAAQLVSQMEESLKRMDAIIYYILSDSDMLNSIEILGRVSNETSSSSYALNAKQQLREGINTEYILKNSFRTVFYNQCGDVVSSFNDVDAYQLSDKFELSELSYLEKAEDARGKTVLVGAHADKWGKTGNKMVYSMMKALRGFQMGYIEVENTVESLGDFEVAEPEAQFLILTNGQEILYSQNDEYAKKEMLDRMADLENGKTTQVDDTLVCRNDSEEYSFSIAAFIPNRSLGDGRLALLVTAVISAFVTFGVCLVLIIIWSYALTKPVRELRAMIEQTSLENLDEQNIHTSQGLDEFAMLTDSYQAMMERLRQAVDNEKRSLLLQMQAQFDTFQAQINPHFLYNVLNIISSRGIEDNDDMICNMCGALASMLRYSTNTIERYAQIGQEIHYLENYLYLLKARYGDKLSFSIDVEPEVQVQILPKMTLHQFVENTLAHGYIHCDRKMEIQVTGKIYQDHWEICVQDNGEGIETEKLEKINKKIEKIQRKILEHRGNIEFEIGGMGLVNTYARCFLLYNDALIFGIRNLQCGVEVKIGEKYDKKTGEETDVSSTGS